MNPKQEAYKKQAQTIIKNLEKRNMEGHYFADSKECTNYILDMIPMGSSIANGGSMTITDIGLLDALKGENYQYIDRMKESFSKVCSANYYLMSTNAITLDGELVNIDGAGNRVSCLIYGPDNVIVVAGMNKVTTTVTDAQNRVRNTASPANTTRLNKNTPCAVTGVCGDCLSPDCICNQIVITRRSGIKNRIKVFLIGEELGY
ncbi:MAG TPA: lactate utilization protein [Lachnospiraceae bacterium]|nr:lactate utilization protein [Lachnospiraceae bacterium]